MIIYIALLFANIYICVATTNFEYHIAYTLFTFAIFVLMGIPIFKDYVPKVNKMLTKR